MLECGMANKDDLADRIVGGSLAEPNEYPWIVAIMHMNNNQIWCGGSIITTEHILSAAHCFEENE